MPKLSKQDATRTVMQLDGYEGHFGELGDYTVGFETYTADADLAELFKGLPDDRCQCPHWGVVLKGKLKFTSDDGETIIGAGEAYYVPPGTCPTCTPAPRSSSSARRRNSTRPLAVLEKNMADPG